MTLEEYRRDISPCFGCGCWNPDMGCSMPDLDRGYACPLEAEGGDDYGD